MQRDEGLLQRGEQAPRLGIVVGPGARVGVIDRNGNGSGTDHGLPQPTLEREMTEAGFRKVAMYDFTKKDGQDYFLIFEVAR